MYVCMYVCVCVYVCMYVCMYACIYIYTGICIYIHIYIYIKGNWANAVAWALAPLTLAFMMATGCYRCSGLAFLCYAWDASICLTTYFSPATWIEPCPKEMTWGSTISLMSVTLRHQTAPKGQSYPSFPCAEGILTHPPTTDVTAILENRAKGQRGAAGRVGQRPSSLNTGNSPTWWFCWLESKSFQSWLAKTPFPGLLVYSTRFLECVSPNPVGTIQDSVWQFPDGLVHVL